MCLKVRMGKVGKGKGRSELGEKRMEVYAHKLYKEMLKIKKYDIFRYDF